MSLKVKNTIPNLEKAVRNLKNTLPRKLANVAKNHFLDGFRRGGGQTDDSLSGWKERKKKDRQKSRRAILVRTSALKNDVDVRRTTFEEIVLGTSEVTDQYAEVHNEGEGDMPKREFLGDSKKLNNKLNRLILAEFNKVFKR